MRGTALCAAWGRIRAGTGCRSQTTAHSVWWDLIRAGWLPRHPRTALIALQGRTSLASARHFVFCVSLGSMDP